MYILIPIHQKGKEC